MQIISSSRLKSFRACKRFHYYQYVLRRRPREPGEALTFGSFWHAGLEMWWTSLANNVGSPSKDAALEAAYIGLRAALAQTEREIDPFLIVKVEELLRGYHFRWRDQELVVASVEEELTAPLVNPDTNRRSQSYLLGGRIDGSCRDAKERLWQVEHKSSSSDISPGSNYWKRLRMDGQISIYFDLGAANGFDVYGCIYDVAYRPQLKPYLATPDEKKKWTKGKLCKLCKMEAIIPSIDERGKPSGLVELGASGIQVESPRQDCPVCEGSGYEQVPHFYSSLRAEDETLDQFRARLRNDIAENPEKYFQRGEVVRLEEQMHEHRLDTWQTAKTLHTMRRANAYPRNPDACLNMYGKTCDYFDVCTGVTNIDNDHLFMSPDRQHPELSAGEHNPEREGTNDKEDW